ncbi:MAG: Fe-S cluster assembly protein SufD [Aquidulcibacter sp.]|uniref:Fe-S cluster assembly protein SufD n=1 Tax=Aquidulcibacter sp. TaxID=2052990 RepID=UPI0022C27BF2|nr:Fe-S cluster assembly protein SufD [Aquidulcibacter sp.]MCE2890151.1 Fe-S cluster assembly protein SufD [Hyphomonadaceae bacterium]MCZ8208286.1 Fe-S cluster assembly protein SufD [Aquidulcibacter sp.]
MALAELTISAGEAALLNAFPPTEAGDAARAQIAADGLPNRRVEAFKWTDLRAALADGIPESDGSAGLIPACLQDALVLDFAPDGFGLEGEKDLGLIIETEDSLELEGAGPLATMAAGFAPRAVVLRVTQSQSRPVVLRRHPGAPMRVRLELDAGARLTLIDTGLATAGLSTGLLEIEIGSGAELVRYSLQNGDTQAIDLTHTSVDVADTGRYQAIALMFGGKLARAETHVTLAGEGASCLIHGAYLLSGHTHADMTTKVVHASPNGQTRELFKGAVQDRARGVFQGKILVERAAQKTDARQNHHALMLSEGAEIDAKPELEIYADDVQCAHGNTIGALDDQALFYMRQRGIPEAQAKSLLVEAFVTDVFDAIEHEGVREWFSELARTWLEASSS